MRVLVTGADGFIGRQVAAALVAAGHEVAAGVRGRAAGRRTPAQAVACDFAADLSAETWTARLAGVDAVVNCVGILRECGPDTFERVHVEAPKALFRACAQTGVRRVIQISTLGHRDDGEFIASKHRGDAELMTLDLDWVVVRPSVVYSPRGSYGGTSLLRAMAALPGCLFLPGDGQQRLEPISAEDLGQLVVGLLETGAGVHRVVEAVGPETVTLEAYLRSWRRWLGMPAPWTVRVPLLLVTVVAWLGEWLGAGPLGRTMYAMLARGSCGSPGAAEILAGIMGRRARSLGQVLNEQPSFVQDRWHARLYLLEPLLRIALGLLWVASAMVGFVTPQAQIQALLAETGLQQGGVALVYGASLVDLALGVLLLAGWRPVLIGALMFLSVFCYTLFIGVAMPASWLEPFGGLLKNLVLLPAVLVMMALVDRK